MGQSPILSKSLVLSCVGLFCESVCFSSCSMEGGQNTSPLSHNSHLEQHNVLQGLFFYHVNYFSSWPKTQFEIECRCGGHSVTKKV